MIGLLRKDLYVAERSCRLMLVLALMFSVLPNMGALGSTYAIMLAFMLPLNAIAYDERCKWDRYAAMMPCRPGQIVGGKYILSYIYMLLAEAIVLLGALIRGVIAPGSVDWTESLQTGGLLLVAMLFIIALGLPAIYRFGSEKGRLVMIVLLGTGIGTGLAVTTLLLEKNVLAMLPLPALAAGVAALAAAATAVSFRLSVRFYRNRQNGVYD